VWREDWPRYDGEQRRTRVIRSTRDVSVDDPDEVRRSAWAGMY
jgi:para-nitrobenzyl esterase